MEPYESLANAIIVQAVKDYREAIHFLKRHPHTPDLDTEEAMKDKQKRILRERIINNEGERDDVERFFRGTCKNFYCKAWDDLTDEEVLFAARLMGDWYYYGLFINDIAAVQEMFALYGEPENVPPEEIESLKLILEQMLIDEDGR